jgi:hypothetical protein
MGKFRALLLMITLLLFSCAQPGSEPPGSRIEIIRLGAPQYLDTSNTGKIGGVIYALYEEGCDSILLKSCMMRELFKFGIYPSDSLTATYFYHYAEDSFKEQLNYFINYLKPLKDGRLPGNYRSMNNIGCNLLGTWLAILTDSAGNRQYYNFSTHNLPAPVMAVCHQVYMLGIPGPAKQAINYCDINTDSIVTAVLKLPSMDSIELIRKQGPYLRFTPPDIVPD